MVTVWHIFVTLMTSGSKSWTAEAGCETFHSASSCSLTCSGGTRTSKTIFRWIKTLSQPHRNSAAGLGKAAKPQLCSPREGPTGDETWSFLVWKKPGVRISSWLTAGWSGAGVWAELEMVPLGSAKKTPCPPSSLCYEVWIWKSLSISAATSLLGLGMALLFPCSFSYLRSTPEGSTSAPLSCGPGQALAAHRGGLDTPERTGTRDAPVWEKKRCCLHQLKCSGTPRPCKHHSLA